MRVLVLSAVVILSTFLGLQVSAKDNLIPNSSFEYGSCMEDILIWNRMRNVPLEYHGNWSIDSQSAYDGQKSIAGTDELLLSFDHSGAVKDQHILSFYLKTEQKEGSCSVSFSAYSNQEQMVTRSETFQLSSEWKQYRLVVNKLFGGTRRQGGTFGPLQIRISPVDGCKVWLDAVYCGTGNGSYQPDQKVFTQLAAEPEAVPPPEINLKQLAAATASGETTFVVYAKNGGRQVPLQGVMPFAPGLVGRNTRLLLKNNDQIIPCQFTPLTLWPDGKSWQTVLAEFGGDVQADSRQTLTLAYSPGESPRESMLAGQEEDLITVRFGNGLCMLVKAGSPRIWEKISTAEGKEMLGPGLLLGRDPAGRVYQANAGRVEIERNGPLSAVVTRSGVITDEQGSTLGNYSVRLTCRQYDRALHLEMNISNNTRNRDFLVREIFWQAELPGGPRQVSGPLGEFPAGAEAKVLLSANPDLKQYSLSQFSGGQVSVSAESSPPLSLSSGDFRVHLLQAGKYYPAMLGAAADGRTLRGYFWPAAPVKVLSLWRGLSATREFRLEFKPENTLAYFEDPALVLPAAADFSQSGIMIAMAPSDQGKFPLFEQIMNTDEALERCHQDSVADKFQYGLFDYGDHFGDGGWANLESYEDYSLFHRALRAESPEIFRVATASARHYRDIDTHQNRFLPSAHSANHVIGGVGFGHAWVQGILADYLLTGNLRSREVAWKVAAAIRNMPPTDGSIGSGRNFGFYLLTLANCYGVFNDPAFVLRFREQLEYQIKQHSVPPQDSEMQMQRTDHPRQGSLFYTSYSGLVPFHCWYGLLGMELMYEFTRDPFILEVLKEQLPNIMNLDMTYRPQIETNWPGLPAEQALPTMATDYLYGRGALFYPVMVKYSQITGEPGWKNLALDAAYAGLLGGRRKCGLQDIFMASALLQLPGDFQEAEHVQKIQNLLWQAASPTLLNGDFSAWLPYRDLVIPQNGLGKPIYPVWAVAKPYPRNWHFVEGKQIISSMFMRFRPDYYDIDNQDFGLQAPALRLKLETQKWHLKSQDLVSAKTRLEPGEWRFQFRYKPSAGLSQIRMRIVLSDLEFIQGNLEAQLLDQPILSDNGLNLPGSKLECEDVGANGWKLAKISFSLPRRHIGWLKFNTAIAPGCEQAAILLDDFRLEKVAR